MNTRGISPEWLDELKRKNDIISVVSKYVTLEQRGSKFWGCCPFHHEKTPSFCVDQYEGLYHCFGCKEGGDVITFVQKMESCDFHDAITRLAENAKMEVPKFSQDESVIKRKKEKDIVLKILNDAAEHYHENIYKKEAKPAQDYIKSRGFTRHELEDFKIGYSLDWNEMIRYLLNKGYKKEDILSSGVAQSKEEGKLYDAMGERLVFPIYNSFSECIGFSARVLVKTDFAKYKNTPETVVFKKSKVVFGIHLLKKLKQEKGLNQIILVEGQIDVITMHRYGFKNTVAFLGTALTSEHARELRKFADEVIVCFDGDEAGQKATLRSIDILKEAGFRVRIAVLEKGKDPDETLKEEGGQAKMQSIIDGAKAVIDYYIDVEKSRVDMSKPDERADFVKNMLERLKKFTQPEQEAYLPKLRDLSGMPIDVLRRSLGIQILPTFEKESKNVLTNRINGNKRAETFILASYLHKKSYIDPHLDPNKLLSGREKEIEIIKSLTRLSGIYDVVSVDEDEFWQDLVYFNFAESSNNAEQYFAECVWSLAEEKLRAKKEAIMEKYKLSTDLAERRQLLMQAQDVDKKIRDKNLEDFYA